MTRELLLSCLASNRLRRFGLQREGSSWDSCSARWPTWCSWARWRHAPYRSHSTDRLAGPHSSWRIPGGAECLRLRRYAWWWEL